VRDAADDGAWSEFEARYGELIVRFCRRRGLGCFDADDVRQLVMIRLLRALRTRQYDPAQGRFRAFLGRIVWNEIARYRRRPKGAADGVYTVDAELTADPQPAALDEAWEREWVEHHLRVAMRRLRAGHDARTLEVFDRLLAGGGVDEVAREFAMTPAAVQKVKQRIRERLRERIAEQVRDEEMPHE
jgi:RNA polymerase sigma factor (sigma-70 family)